MQTNLALGGLAVGVLLLILDLALGHEHNVLARELLLKLAHEADLQHRQQVSLKSST